MFSPIMMIMKLIQSNKHYHRKIVQVKQRINRNSITNVWMDSQMTQWTNRFFGYSLYEFNSILGQAKHGTIPTNNETKYPFSQKQSRKENSISFGVPVDIVQNHDDLLAIHIDSFASELKLMNSKRISKWSEMVVIYVQNKSDWVAVAICARSSFSHACRRAPKRLQFQPLH